METTLHRQLKELFAEDEANREVFVDGYRIDAVVEDQLVEVQLGSLGAIRDKVRNLLQSHQVLVVKPLAASKLLIKRKRSGGTVQSRRRSPKRAELIDVFEDLVHFVTVFPHPHLTVRVLLTEQEEDRLPKRKRRRRSKDYQVEDRRLVDVVDSIDLQTPGDLLSFVPGDVASPFTTKELAEALDQPRWFAQKIAYCLRHTGAIEPCGKERNAILYRRAVSQCRAA